MSSSTFTGNQAITASGLFGDAGAIDVEYSAVATISNSSFTGNVAMSPLSQGGALLAEGCTLTLSNTSFTGNQAYGGGALYFLSGANVTISNSSFTANLAQGGAGLGGQGGAIDNAGGTVTLTTARWSATRRLAVPASPPRPPTVSTAVVSTTLRVGTSRSPAAP